MDVNQRLNEIRYLARRAMDLAATEGASGEAWDNATRALRELQELDAHLCRGEQLPRAVGKGCTELGLHLFSLATGLRQDRRLSTGG